jgi:hypothetical protein
MQYNLLPMDSDFLVKLLIMLGIMAGIFLAGRLVSGPPREDFKLPEQPPLENETGTRSPLVGSEIPFPFDVRELETQYGEDARRPRILNYYFSKTDLVRGPDDRDRFYDHLFVEYHDDDSNHRWTSEHLVATPGGLERMMAEQGYKSLYGDGMIIVPRYDLAAIMRAAVELHMDTGEGIKRGIEVSVESPESRS